MLVGKWTQIDVMIVIMLSRCENMAATIADRRAVGDETRWPVQFLQHPHTSLQFYFVSKQLSSTPWQWQMASPPQLSHSRG